MTTRTVVHIRERSEHLRDAQPCIDTTRARAGEYANNDVKEVPLQIRTRTHTDVVTQTPHQHER